MSFTLSNWTKLNRCRLLQVLSMFVLGTGKCFFLYTHIWAHVLGACIQASLLHMSDWLLLINSRVLLSNIPIYLFWPRNSRVFSFYISICMSFVMGMLSRHRIWASLRYMSSKLLLIISLTCYMVRVLSAWLLLLLHHRYDNNCRSSEKWFDTKCHEAKKYFISLYASKYMENYQKYRHTI